MDPLLDQTYFSNAKKAQHTKKGNKPYNKTDFKLYRKDIYDLTKNLLNRKIKDDDINYYFDEFIQHAIEYLKFKEKETQIQETYSDLDMNSKSMHVFNTPKTGLLNKLEETNMLMYKDYNLKTISMDQFVKKKQIKEVQPLHIPAQKQIKYKERIKKTNSANSVRNVDNKKEIKKENKKENKKKKTMKIEF